LILGATGGTGRKLVEQALEGGHEVTAFVRSIPRLPVGHPRLRPVEGSLPGDVQALAVAMRGQDAVISALGRGSSFKSEGLIGGSVPLILAAMRDLGVRRLILTSAIGVGRAFRDAPAITKLMIRLLLKDIYADKAVGEELIGESDLDWTIVQPSLLTNGGLTGKYQAGEKLHPAGIPKISRADTAHYLLSALGDPSSVRKIVRIGY
jgi:putative NADH-flavin reductase